MLLRNEAVDGRPVLPFDTGSTVAVIGPLADVVNLGDGGSSDVWDLDCRTVLDGLRRVAGAVVHDDGSDTASAAAVAASADVAVVVVGFTFRDEGEYIGESNPALASDVPARRRTRRRRPLRRRPVGSGADREAGPSGTASAWVQHGRGPVLPAPVGLGRGALIRAVVAANPRTPSSPSRRAAPSWCRSGSTRSRRSCSPGTAGVAQVTHWRTCWSARSKPSGRLPFSVPVEEADLPHFDRDATQFTYDRWFGWWHLARSGRAPLFAFAPVSRTPRSRWPTPPSRGTRPSGRRRHRRQHRDRPGSDVVQVYADLPHEDRPARLVGFARVDVAAGGRADVTIEVALDRLAVRDPATHTWVPPTGPHTIRVHATPGIRRRSR